MARVSNIMAAAAISTALYMFVTGGIPEVPEALLVSVIVGFAARHLWDSSHEEQILMLSKLREC